MPRSSMEFRKRTCKLNVTNSLSNSNIVEDDYKAQVPQSSRRTVESASELEVVRSNKSLFHGLLSPLRATVIRVFLLGVMMFMLWVAFSKALREPRDPKMCLILVFQLAELFMFIPKARRDPSQSQLWTCICAFLISALPVCIMLEKDHMLLQEGFYGSWGHVRFLDVNADGEGIGGRGVLICYDERDPREKFLETDFIGDYTRSGGKILISDYIKSGDKLVMPDDTRYTRKPLISDYMIELLNDALNSEVQPHCNNERFGDIRDSDIYYLKFDWYLLRDLTSLLIPKGNGNLTSVHQNLTGQGIYKSVAHVYVCKHARKQLAFLLGEMCFHLQTGSECFKAYCAPMPGVACSFEVANNFPIRLWYRLTQLLPFACVALVRSISPECVFSCKRLLLLVIKNIGRATDLFVFLECCSIHFYDIDYEEFPYGKKAQQYDLHKLFRNIWIASLLHLFINNISRDNRSTPSNLARPRTPEQRGRSQQNSSQESAAGRTNQLHAIILSVSSCLLHDVIFLWYRVKIKHSEFKIQYRYNPRLEFFFMKNIFFIIFNTFWASAYLVTFCIKRLLAAKHCQFH